MRTNNKSKIKLTMYFPYDHPDGNGYIYTKDAVSEAFTKDLYSIPIILQGEEVEEKYQIGMITSHQCEMEDDEENSCYKFTLDGVILHSGTSENGVCDDGKITHFDIQSIGVALK